MSGGVHKMHVGRKEVVRGSGAAEAKLVPFLLPRDFFASPRTSHHLTVVHKPVNKHGIHNSVR
jgi:hypothetical protein